MLTLTVHVDEDQVRWVVCPPCRRTWLATEEAPINHARHAHGWEVPADVRELTTAGG